MNSSLETAVDNIYAVGDVKGGPQFTYISLDDYRSLKSNSGNKNVQLKIEVMFHIQYS